jgi:hypothetical protein
MDSGLVDWLMPTSWWDVVIGLVVFAVSFVVSLAVVIWVILKLPVDYLRDGEENPVERNHWLPASLLIALWRNLIGLVLVVIGIILSLPGVPGQGFLTIVLGLMLMQFPGKRYLEKRLLGRPDVLGMLNRIRQRYGREPLLPPEPAAAEKPVVAATHNAGELSDPPPKPSNEKQDPAANPLT